MMNFIAIILICTGLFFSLVGAIGAIRLPDFYSRSHALGVMDTLGTLLILGGLASYYGLSVVTAKLFMIIMFFYLANPTITHVLTRAAFKSGLKPWSQDLL